MLAWGAQMDGRKMRKPGKVLVERWSSAQTDRTLRDPRGAWQALPKDGSYGICASCLPGTWNTPSIVAKRRWCLVLAAPHSIFNVQRHLTSARTHRAFRASAMQAWREVVAAA